MGLAGPPVSQPASRRAARYALLVLTVINFLNYIDRYVVASVVEPIKRELGFSDSQLGWILSAFMLSYAVAAPVFGRLGDLSQRKYLVSLGVGLWSLATAGAGCAQSFWQMWVPRALVGVGEASYATLAPTILADYYAPARRGRALAIFYAAIPAGSAMGFILGGQLAHHFGWRAAFFVVGLPGLALALLALSVREPVRGATEPCLGLRAPPALLKVYAQLWQNSTYVTVSLGYVAYTFALGGLVGWMPAFLERYASMSTGRANQVFGTVTVIAGFLGTFLGGFLGDYLLRYSKHAYLWLSGLGTLAGAPVAVVALSSRDPTVMVPAIFVAECLLFLNTGPLNAVLLGCVGAEIRATAMAVNIFLIHAFGDALSPLLIGALSDRVGLARASLIAPAMMIASGCIILRARHAQSSPGASSGSGKRMEPT